MKISLDSLGDTATLAYEAGLVETYFDLERRLSRRTAAGAREALRNVAGELEKAPDMGA